MKYVANEDFHWIYSKFVLTPLSPKNAVVLVYGVNGVEHRFQSLNSAVVNGVTAWYVFVGRLLVHGE